MLRMHAGGRMNFSIRILVEHEFTVEAGSLTDALTHAEQVIAKSPYKAKLLGVLAPGQEWPDAEKSAPRPPRNTPPSGSPGTPTVTTPPEVANAVAA